jgi:hypothetical protein
MDSLDPAQYELLRNLANNKTLMASLRAENFSDNGTVSSPNLQPSSEYQITENDISQSQESPLNHRSPHPVQSSRRDQGLNQLEPGRTQRDQRQLSDISSTHQPRQSQQSDPKSQRKPTQKKGRAVVASNARVTKAKSSHPRPSTQPSPSKSKTVARLISLQDVSNEDTATEGGRSPTLKSQHPSVDIHMSNLTSSQSDALGSLKRFIVGLDFGTTTTAVSYYSHPVDDITPMAFPREVKSIMNWQGDDMDGVRKQVPTESWYSPIPRTRPLLQDQLGLDNLDPESSDSSDEEDTSDKEDTNSETSDALSMPHAKYYNRDSNQYEQGSCDCAEATQYIWGYDVFNARYHEVITRDPHTRIERSKSMLVRSPYTQDDRVTLRTCLDHLLDLGLIRKYGKKDVPIPRDVQDVISDFLTQVLGHTGQQLTQYAGLTTRCPVSFVVTVPVIWSPHSSRVFQYALEDAIRHSGFGDFRNGSVGTM